MEKELFSEEYSMLDTAQACNFKSRIRLFTFLRKYNIIQGNYPSPEFVSMGYFTVVFHDIRVKGKHLKTVPVIRATKKGIKFIKDLYKLINRDAYHV